MNYWLMKTEPNTYSWDDLVLDTKKKGAEEWDGVRNYAARNHMRNMSVGDLVFIYHSVKDREIVGIAKVTTAAHPDSTDDTGKWDCTDVAAVKPVNKIINLDDVKANPKLVEMALVKYGRLSVQPVTAEEWRIVMGMMETEV